MTRQEKIKFIASHNLDTLHNITQLSDYLLTAIVTLITRHPKRTVEEKKALGNLFAEVFMLKKSRDYPNRYDSTWGNKTALGLYLTLERFITDSTIKLLSL